MPRVVTLLLVMSLTVALAGQELLRTPRLKVVVLEEDTGLPLANVSLWITTATSDGRTVTTDGAGTATLYDLPPGNYDVHPNSPAHLPARSGRAIVTADRLEILNLRMVRGGVIAGVVTDHGGEPVSNAQVTLLDGVGGRVGKHPIISRLKTVVTSGNGAFEFAGLTAGDYRLAAKPDAGLSAFNDFYYPGTLEIERSELVRTAPGDRLNLTLRMGRVPIERVRGLVVDDEVADRRELTVRRLDVDTGDAISHTLIDIHRDGTFAVGLESAIHGFTYTVTGAVKAVAYAVVHVGEKPVPPVNLRARRLSTMSGRFVFGEANKPPSDGLAVSARPVGEDAPLRSSSQSEVRDDGTFLLRALLGNHRFSVATPPGWLPVAIFLDDGRDILHKEIEIQAEREYPNVRVVLTDEVATIEGSVPSTAAMDAMVVAFPVDDSTWVDYESTPKATAMGDGRFTIHNVRPWTEYFVAECGWPCWTRHHDLEKLSGTALRVQIGRPGTYSVVLRR